VSLKWRGKLSRVSEAGNKGGSDMVWFGEEETKRQAWLRGGKIAGVLAWK
jgi:hypothetical protein